MNLSSIQKIVEIVKLYVVIRILIQHLHL